MTAAADRPPAPTATASGGPAASLRSWPITLAGQDETVTVFHSTLTDTAMIAVSRCADLSADEARCLAEVLSAAAHVAEDTPQARSRSWSITLGGHPETVHIFTRLTDRTPMIGVSGFTADLTIREARHLAGILCAAAHAADTAAPPTRRGPGRPPTLSYGDRQHVRALHRSGRSVAGIAAQFGVSPPVITRIVRDTRP